MSWKGRQAVWMLGVLWAVLMGMARGTLYGWMRQETKKHDKEIL